MDTTNEEPPSALLGLVADFLGRYGYSKAHRALNSEHEKKGSTTDFKSLAQDLPTLAELYKQWSDKKEVEYQQSEILKDNSTTTSDSDSEEEVKDAVSGTDMAKSSDDESGDASSESSSELSDDEASDESSSEDESEDEEEVADKIVLLQPPNISLALEALNDRKRKAESESSASDGDSGSGSSSSSSASSDSEPSPPKSKKTKLSSKSKKPAAKSRSSSASSSSSSSSSSEEDSSSDSGSGNSRSAKAKKAVSSRSSSPPSSSSDSDSDVSSSKIPKRQTPGLSKKASYHSSSSSDSDNDSDDEASSVESEPESRPKSKAPKSKSTPESKKPAQEIGTDRRSSASDSSATVVADQSPIKVSANGIKRKLEDDTSPLPTSESDSKRLKKQNTPFSRIAKDQFVDPRFSSNRYVSYDYADRAHQDLSVTKGKGFTKEKNKKKKGSYAGGRIHTGVGQGVIKFDD